MLHPDAVKQIPAWKERKQAQWERIKDRIPGLQLVRYGERNTTYMLTVSTPDFYESVMIGRLPYVKPVPRRGAKSEEFKEILPLIDLADEQIDAIIERWEMQRSALGLTGVGSVWGHDGRERKLR